MNIMVIFRQRKQHYGQDKATKYRKPYSLSARGKAAKLSPFPRGEHAHHQRDNSESHRGQ